MSNGNASDHRPRPAAALPPDEPVAGSNGQPESIPPRALLAQVLDRANLQRALIAKCARTRARRASTA